MDPDHADAEDGLGTLHDGALVLAHPGGADETVVWVGRAAAAPDADRPGPGRQLHRRRPRQPGRGNGHRVRGRRGRISGRGRGGRDHERVEEPPDVRVGRIDGDALAFDGAVAHASHSTEAMLKLAGEIAQPISNRVAVMADRVKSAA